MELPADFTHDDTVGALGAPALLLIDDYGREHVLIDDGAEMLEGQLDLADGPMPYWIPRAVAETWRTAA
ncbi:hypothetical protein DLM45_10850 [Hyphomicrobium methylovorum]|uniref:hypothetical protein n=1 Tax=Hyphomicrobium methylovorum TaxID=84 RepID=UPI0015E78F16|nr:hypothetical protein [Hyphomicrobium methylovorum]MBA2126710.1 hypothetical protein [Hyphomicrobium methylovorum]